MNLSGCEADYMTDMLEEDYKRPMILQGGGFNCFLCKFPLGVMAYHVSVFHLVVGSCLLKIKPLGWLLKEERKKESEDSADFHVAKPIEN